MGGLGGGVDDELEVTRVFAEDLEDPVEVADVNVE